MVVKFDKINLEFEMLITEVSKWNPELSSNPNALLVSQHYKNLINAFNQTGWMSRLSRNKLAFDRFMADGIVQYITRCQTEKLSIVSFDSGNDIIAYMKTLGPNLPKSNATIDQWLEFFHDVEKQSVTVIDPKIRIWIYRDVAFGIHHYYDDLDDEPK